MATNAYLPQDDCRLENRGFRWCTKDKRWESKTTLAPEQVTLLSRELHTRVESIVQGAVKSASLNGQPTDKFNSTRI